MFWNFWRKAEPERAIFSFFDGKKTRKADPMVVYRALVDDPVFNIEVDSSLVLEANDLEASARMSAVIRKAFGIAAFDDGGLTEGECDSLFYAFMDWLTEKKNSGSQPLTPPTCSESSLQPEHSATPTNPASGCGSIATESNPDVSIALPPA